GDTLFADAPNCFDAYGTSYLVQWNSSQWGIQFVTAVGTDAAHAPLKVGGKKNMVHKIIAGDWNYHANRPISAGPTVWHGKPRPGSQRKMNILFGDYHAEEFAFPLSYEQQNPATPGAVKPDPYGEYW